MQLTDALAAHHRPQPATESTQQTIYIAGATGKFGEALLAQAVAHAQVREVMVAVQQALPSTEAKMTPVLPQALPERAQAAVLVLSDADEPPSYYGRDAVYVRVTDANLLEQVQALVLKKVARLALVQPMDFWQQPDAVRGLLASEEELAISMLGFECLLIVRPARTEGRFVGGSRLRRLVNLYLSQFRWLAPARLPLTHRDVAHFVVDQLLTCTPGVHVIEAGQLEKLIYPDHKAKHLKARAA